MQARFPNLIDRLKMQKNGLLPELTPRHREAFVGYLFILPTYIGFTIFILYPLIESVRISFQEFSLLRGSTYIGFDNYAQMLACAYHI